VVLAVSQVLWALHPQGRLTYEYPASIVGWVGYGLLLEDIFEL
jgi:hypothetical protein